MAARSPSPPTIDRRAFDSVLRASLCEMGFAEPLVARAIARCDGDAARALDLVLADQAVAGETNVSERRKVASAMPLQAAALERAHAAERRAKDDLDAHAGPSAAQQQRVIYSKLPDFSGASSSTSIAEREREALGAAAHARSESARRLLRLSAAQGEVLGDQQASRHIADQLRLMLYTADGKVRPPTRKGATPAPPSRPAKAKADGDAAAAAVELGDASPMHVVHYAMLQDDGGLPLSVNAFNGRKYAKSFIGADAYDWVLRCVHGVSPARAEEICKKLVRGRFLLQIDYKNELRPFSASEVYRLNPKSKLLLPGAVPPTFTNFPPSDASNGTGNGGDSHSGASSASGSATTALPALPSTPSAGAANHTRTPSYDSARGTADERKARSGVQKSMVDLRANGAAELERNRRPRAVSTGGAGSIDRLIDDERRTDARTAPARDGNQTMYVAPGSAASRRSSGSPNGDTPQRGSGQRGPRGGSFGGGGGRSSQRGGVSDDSFEAPPPDSQEPLPSSSSNLLYDAAPPPPSHSVSMHEGVKKRSPESTPPGSRTLSASAFPASLDDEFASFHKHDWYHGRISKTAAEERVGDVPGNFLLRDSSKRGCLCITYVSSRRGRSHVLVEKIDGRWTMKGATAEWRTIPDLLQTYAKVYQKAIRPPDDEI